MKAIERIAIVICVVEVLRQVSAYFSSYTFDFVQSVLGVDDRTAMFWARYIPQTITWLLVNLMIAIWIFVDAPRHRIARPVWVALGLVAGVLGLAVYLLRVLIGKYESGQQPHPTCSNCGYDLFGIPKGRCPECGSSSTS